MCRCAVKQLLTHSFRNNALLRKPTYVSNYFLFIDYVIAYNMPALHASSIVPFGITLAVFSIVTCGSVAQMLPAKELPKVNARTSHYIPYTQS